MKVAARCFTIESMAHRTLHVAAYDVRNPKRLRQALAVLKQFATGGQKSVFECYLTDSEKRRLLSQIDAVIDPVEDSFLLTPLDERSPIHVLGIAIPPSDPPFYYAG